MARDSQSRSRSRSRSGAAPPDGGPATERRQHPRIPFLREVRYRFPDLDSFKRRHASDLSMGGMFLRTDDPEPEGTILYFEFEADASRIFGGFARVVRVNPPDEPEAAPGMGLEFLQLDDESRRTLQLLLQAQSAGSGS